MPEVVRGGLRDLLDRHVDELRRAGVASPEVDVRLLAAHVLGEERLRGGSAPPPPAAIQHLAELVSRRARRIPLQHLVGEVWFRHVRIECRPGVFVPRPETEIVAGIAIAAARECGQPVIAEPCTGSGAIAVSLAAEVTGARIIATDLAPAAVALTTANLERLERGEAGVDGPAAGVVWEVREGDLFAPLSPALHQGVDVIVANPPYLPARERGTWEPEVAEHDPVAATVGGVDGHEVVWRILEGARRWLAPGGVLVVEIDERRGEETAARATQLGYGDVEVRRDLTGAERAVVAVQTDRPMEVQG